MRSHRRGQGLESPILHLYIFTLNNYLYLAIERFFDSFILSFPVITIIVTLVLIQVRCFGTVCIWIIFFCLSTFGSRHILLLCNLSGF